MASLLINNSLRNESVNRYRIFNIKSLYKFSDMHVFQFASVQDLVHFFTLYPLDSGVTLRPMNVTEYYMKLKEQKRMGAPAVESDSQVSDVRYTIHNSLLLLILLIYNYICYRHASTHILLYINVLIIGSQGELRGGI